MRNVNTFYFNYLIVFIIFFLYSTFSIQCDFEFSYIYEIEVNEDDLSSSNSLVQMILKKPEDPRKHKNWEKWSWAKQNHKVKEYDQKTKDYERQLKDGWDVPEIPEGKKLNEAEKKAYAMAQKTFKQGSEARKGLTNFLLSNKSYERRLTAYQKRLDDNKWWFDMCKFPALAILIWFTSMTIYYFFIRDKFFFFIGWPEECRLLINQFEHYLEKKDNSKEFVELCLICVKELKDYSQTKDLSSLLTIQDFRPLLKKLNDLSDFCVRSGEVNYRKHSAGFDLGLFLSHFAKYTSSAHLHVQFAKKWYPWFYKFVKKDTVVMKSVEKTASSDVKGGSTQNNSNK